MKTTTGKMRSLRESEQEDRHQTKMDLECKTGVLLVSYGGSSLFRFNGFHLSLSGLFRAGTPTSDSHGKSKRIFCTSLIWHNSRQLSLKSAGSRTLMANKDDDTDEDEFALFRQEMRDATRIRQNRLIHNKPKPVAKAIRQKIIDDEYQGEPFSDMFSPETVGNEEYLEYRGPGIQHKLFGKLRNGKVHIEAELDLHGMTIAKAEPTLSEFLEFCQQQQIRCVRIIHGKGWGSRDNKPVLKSKLNHWLRQSQSVLAFCSATVDDGGTGALYVLLKRLFHE
jgi:DNA-nicking Smr family endonuclease